MRMLIQADEEHVTNLDTEGGFWYAERVHILSSAMETMVKAGARVDGVSRQDQTLRAVATLLRRTIGDLVDQVLETPKSREQ